MPVSWSIAVITLSGHQLQYGSYFIASVKTSHYTTIPILQDIIVVVILLVVHCNMAPILPPLPRRCVWYSWYTIPYHDASVTWYYCRYHPLQYGPYSPVSAPHRSQCPTSMQSWMLTVPKVLPGNLEFEFDWGLVWLVWTRAFMGVGSISFLPKRSDDIHIISEYIAPLVMLVARTMNEVLTISFSSSAATRC